MKNVKTIGIVGGGQLGRMLTLAAIPLGFKVAVVETSDNCPAAQAGARVICGNLYDRSALRELAQLSDFITVEIEHLDSGALEYIASSGKAVNPAPETLSMIQDKLQQKEILAAAGIPLAPFSPITDYNNALGIWRQFGHKMMIKTRFGAYDGRGNMLVTSKEKLKKALELFAGKQLYAEEYIPFKKELAIMIARSLDGDIKSYPVVETIHKRNICMEVRAPAEINIAARNNAVKVAFQTANILKGAGVFGIELFLTHNDKVLLNEIAPRVHNSGHYTLEAARTSQFEQHIRAISGLPLGDTGMIIPAAVMINILGERNGPTYLQGLDEALAIEHTSVHMYGKSPTKIDRKMGHITATGSTIRQARNRAISARKHLSI